MSIAFVARFIRALFIAYDFFSDKITGDYHARQKRGSLMLKKQYFLMFIMFWCARLNAYTIVIVGEPACDDPCYLQEGRKPHRVMNTVLEAWCQILEQLEPYGVTTTVIGRKSVNLYPSGDLYIFWDMPNAYDDPMIAAVAHKSFVILCEPISIFAGQYNPHMLAQFKQVFTWDDQFARTFNFKKYCLPVLKPYKGSPVPFAQKKLACMLCGNKSSWVDREMYSERRSIINFFTDRHPELFDLYGSDWPQLATYRGMVPDKLYCLQNYLFNFCLENTRNTTGYITEKIFDAMQAGTIPIYAGASNIDEYIPRNCYINYADFTCLETMKKHMSSLTEKDYNEYQNNIRAYLASEQAHKFAIEPFVELFVGEIRQFFGV